MHPAGVSRSSRPPTSCCGAAPSGRLPWACALALAAACAWPHARSAAQGLDPSIPLPHLHFETWSTDQGLPQNSVNSVLQTSDGYLWVGTFEGLARFDGVRFRVFDVTSTPQLLASAVSRMREDSRGRLWVAFRSGGGLARFVHGRLERVWSTADGLLSDTVWDVVEDRSGTVWVATQDGLNRVDGDTVGAAPVGHPLLRDEISALLVDRRGVLWIGSRNEGLGRLEAGRLEVLTTADGLGSTRVYALDEDRDGALWVADGREVHRLADGRLTLARTTADLGGEYVRAIHVDRRGAVWLGTYGGTGRLMRLSGGAWQSFSSRDGLGNTFLRCVAEDREGSVWFGSNGGLHRLRDSKFKTLTTRDGLRASYARVVIEDGRGRIWVGTDGGGVNAYADGSFSAITAAEGLLGDSVRALAVGADDELWVGVYGRGVNRVQGGVVRQAITLADGLPSLLIRALHVDAAGDLWVGTEGGLARVSEGRLALLGAADGILSDDVFVVQSDGRGTVWVGTGGGLYAYRDERFTAYPAAGGSPGNAIYALHLDRDRTTLWIGSEGGLGSYREDRGFASFGRHEGMLRHAIFQVLEDDSGRLWLSSNNGVLSVAKADLERAAAGRGGPLSVARYGKADGMRSAQCNGTSQPAGWRSSDGQLWFPTADGVAVIAPDRIPLNAVPPPVLVEDFVVDGRSLPLAPGATVTVPPGAEKFEIHYAGLSFVAPQQVRFQYRLEGMDDSWVDPGTRRTAYYTNLAPGQHAFRVRAANNDGVWSTADAVLRFEVEPYLYQRRWFAATIGVLLLGGLVGGVRARSTQLLRRARELERLVDERTTELSAYTRELETLDEIVATINREPDLDHVMMAVLEQGAVLLPAASTGAFLASDGAGGGFSVRASRGWGPERLPGLRVPASVAVRVLADEAEALADGVCLVRDPGDQPGAGPLRPLLAADTVLALSLPLAGEVMGFLVFDVGCDRSALRSTDLLRLGRYRQHAITALARARALRELEAANDELQRLATVDALTGVANRRHFDAALELEWSRARRGATEVSLLMVDVDHFKRFNDAYGHQQGDECLAAVAGALQGVVSRAIDVVARYGGEEFAVILPATNAAGALSLADRVRRAVEGLAIAHERSDVAAVVTISVGVATVRPNGSGTPADLVAAADAALYRAKREGRNRIATA